MPQDIRLLSLNKFWYKSEKLCRTFIKLNKMKFLSLLTLFVLTLSVSSESSESSDDVLAEKRCSTAYNSNKLTCRQQCGECMEYCSASNIRKLSSDCGGGKTCCVLTRRNIEKRDVIGNIYPFRRPKTGSSTSSTTEI